MQITLRYWPLTLLLVALLPQAARGQDERLSKVVLTAENPPLANRLRAADRRRTALHSPIGAAALAGQLTGDPIAIVFGPGFLVAEQHATEHWERLADEYYQLARDGGDVLVSLPPSERGLSAAASSVQLRRLALRRLALLPRTIRQDVARRVEAEARQQFERGSATRSPEALRRLVAEVPWSRHSARALDLLGDLAFEHGDFDEALAWWHRLLTPTEQVFSADAGDAVDRVRVRAKHVLALAFQGRLAEAGDALDEFTRLHREATGHLAGQQGPYYQTLRQVLDGLRRQGPFADREAWATFAGGPSRSRVLMRCPTPALWEDGPTWRVKLPVVPGLEPPPAPTPREWRAAFHPVIAEGKVLLADARAVVGYELKTGKRLFRYELPAPKAPAVEVDGHSPDVRRPRRPRFTMTVESGRAYARLGAPAFGPLPPRTRAEPSYLVCLDLTDQGGAPGRELWRVEAQTEDGQPAYFEGAPLVRNGRVWIAVSRLSGRRTQTALACYDTRGKRRWLRDVCEAPEFEENLSPRYRQNLLTWAGSRLVYCTHAGAVVAVDPWTGQPAWAMRYPSRGPLTTGAEPSPRDLTPCVYAEGRVLAAPLDRNVLYGLDATTGRVVWEQEAVEVVHLLGAARGRAYVATRDGVQALSLATGRVIWRQPAGGRLPSLGRGLLAGDWLLWPTCDPKLPLRAVTQAHGNQRAVDGIAGPFYDPTQLRALPAGNMAFGEGCLAIAGTDELVVFVPPEHGLPPEGAHLKQARAAALDRLARSQIVAGRLDDGRHTLLRLLSEVKESPDAARWLETVILRLTRLVHEQAAAGADLTPYVAPEVPAAVRLVAHQAQVLRAQREGKTATSLVLCRRLLDDADARSAWLLDADHVPRRGVEWARGQERILRDRRAPIVMAPNDIAVLTAKVADAVKSRDWGRVAEVCRRLARDDAPTEVRAAALHRLARAYEVQGCLRAAWQTWQALCESFGERRDPESGRRYRALRPSGEEEPYRRLTAPAEPLSLPLVQAWEVEAGTLLQAERLGALEPADSFCYTARGAELACHDSRDGTPRWRAQLDGPPTWLGRHADLILAGSRDGVAALRLHDGRAAWSWPAPSRWKRSVLVRNDQPHVVADSLGVTAFRLDDAHLIVLDEQARFFALDPTSGAVAWHVEAPGGRLRPLGMGTFQPYFLSLRGTLLAQLADGKAAWLGSKGLWTRPTIDESPTWQGPPRALGRAVVVPDRSGSVVCRDISSKDVLWTYAPPWPTSLVGAAPRLFGGARVLLAVIPRTLGPELVRLDANSGRPLWTIPAGTLPQGPKPITCVGASAVYVASADQVRAYSLTGGELLWQRRLPSNGAGWELRYLGSALAVAPRTAPALPRAPLPVPVYAWPVVPRAGKTDRADFAIVLLDPQDGSPLQRLGAERGVEGRFIAVPGGLVANAGGRLQGFRPAGEE